MWRFGSAFDRNLNEYNEYKEESMPNNTMKFFGLVAEKKPSTNLIWAFTPDPLTDQGWVSEKVPNQETLIQNMKAAIEAKKLLVLAVPTHSYRTDDFKSLLENSTKNWKVETFRIRVLDGTAFTTNLFFKGVERLGKPLPQAQSNRDASHLVVKLKAKFLDTIPDNL